MGFPTFTSHSTAPRLLGTSLYKHVKSKPVKDKHERNARANWLALKGQDAGKETESRSLPAVHKTDGIEGSRMTNEEARIIQFEAYAKVYRPEAAAEAVKALEDRLAARGMTLPEYVTEQDEIRESVQSQDRESEPERSTFYAKVIEQIQTVWSIVDEPTRKKATALLQADLLRGCWFLLNRPAHLTMTEPERVILDFIRG